MAPEHGTHQEGQSAPNGAAGDKGSVKVHRQTGNVAGVRHEPWEVVLEGRHLRGEKPPGAGVPSFVCSLDRQGVA